MAYPFEETFETGIPTGFATPGGYGGVTATWNEALQAVDLVFDERQSFWRIHAATTSEDFWFEFEAEMLERTYSSVTVGAWLWAGDRYNGHRLTAWKQIWHHCWWQADGSQRDQVELVPADWAVVGARRTLRFDAKRIDGDLWLMQITDNGEIAWRGYERAYTSLLPCVYGYGLTMRLFRVAGGTPSALPDAPAQVKYIGYAPRLGHRILDAATAAAQRYNQRAFHKLDGTRNHHYHGHYRITGTVKERGVPDDKPVSRRVLLFDERTQICVRETWSDAVTGEYLFDEISGVPRYFVVAFDHRHNYRAVIADNLRAEPRPSS